MRATLMGLRPLLILAAAGVGLLVLLVSFAGDATGEPGAQSERMTPEEVSTMSAETSATQVAKNRKVTDEYVASRKSVADIPRGEIAGTYIEQPVDVETARLRADEVVAGVVQEQYLARGAHHTATSIQLTYLVSVVRQRSDGRLIEIAQVAGLVDDQWGLALTYLEAPLLEYGKEYAIFAVQSPMPGKYIALRGQVYSVGTQGTLTPLMPSDATRQLDGASVDGFIRFAR